MPLGNFSKEHLFPLWVSRLQPRIPGIIHLVSGKGNSKRPTSQNQMGGNDRTTTPVSESGAGHWCPSHGTFENVAGLQIVAMLLPRLNRHQG